MTLLTGRPNVPAGTTLTGTILYTTPYLRDGAIGLGSIPFTWAEGAANPTDTRTNTPVNLIAARYGQNDPAPRGELRITFRIGTGLGQGSVLFTLPVETAAGVLDISKPVTDLVWVAGAELQTLIGAAQTAVAEVAANRQLLQDGLSDLQDAQAAFLTNAGITRYATEVALLAASPPAAGTDAYALDTGVIYRSTGSAWAVLGDGPVTLTKLGYVIAEYRASHTPAQRRAYLQSRLDAAAGRQLYIQPGDWALDNAVRASSKTVITGAGRGATILRLTQATSPVDGNPALLAVITNTNAASHGGTPASPPVDSDIHISNLTFDAGNVGVPNSSTRHNGVKLLGVDRVSVRDCEVINCTGYGIWLPGCRNFKISGNTVRHAEECIELAVGARDGEIIGNLTIGTAGRTTTGILIYQACQRVNVDHNICLGQGNGITVSESAGVSTDIIIGAGNRVVMDGAGSALLLSGDNVTNMRTQVLGGYYYSAQGAAFQALNASRPVGVTVRGGYFDGLVNGANLAGGITISGGVFVARGAVGSQQQVTALDGSGLTTGAEISGVTLSGTADAGVPVSALAAPTGAQLSRLTVGAGSIQLQTGTRVSASRTGDLTVVGADVVVENTTVTGTMYSEGARTTLRSVTATHVILNGADPLIEDVKAAGDFTVLSGTARRTNSWNNGARVADLGVSSGGGGSSAPAPILASGALENSGNLLPLAANTFVQIVFNARSGDGWGTDGRWTAPRAGIVTATWAAQFAPQAGDEVYLTLFKNGTRLGDIKPAVAGSTLYLGAGGGYSLDVAQGDVLDIRAYQSGSTKLIEQGVRTYAQFLLH